MWKTLKGLSTLHFNVIAGLYAKVQTRCKRGVEMWICLLENRGFFEYTYGRIASSMVHTIIGSISAILQANNGPHFMKKTLLLALIALSGINSKAQKIELGLNGGLAPYIWADNTFKNYGGSKKDQPGYYGSARVSLTLIGFQFGVGFDMFQTGVKTRIMQPIGEFKNTTKYSTLTPYLFLNKIFRLPKSYIYAGINGGYNTGTSKGEISAPFMSVTKTNATYSGFTGGAQLGFTLNLAKGLGVNAEAAAKYIKMAQKVTTGPAPSTSHLIFPVSLGVRYTF